ncbi:MAG: restriction endonuclease [Alphaproteobacteria bacterium HGW-Alphaproteobacteria-10]|nr:MAG: restriction endonuclease [Alphaproteobacteria bacterium HGW-Alphaproteobacteria-10]
MNLFAALGGKYEIFDWRNASAILQAVHPQQAVDIADVLGRFTLKHSALAVGGGNKSQISKFIDTGLYARGWVEKAFDTKFVVDGVEYPSPTHSVDCVKGSVALEVEWNNKDPFFDRDLNNFRLLYDLRIIDVGVIVTRATSLEQVLYSIGRATTTYGKATTHTAKLFPKIQGGGAGGCPVLVFGIAGDAYVDDRNN